MNPFNSKQRVSQSDSATENLLTTILEQEQCCLSEVIQLLKTEKEAIVERDIEVMGHLLDQKLPLLSKLEQLDKQHQHYFEQQTGLAYQHKDFAHYIKQQCSDTTQKIWSTIKEQLAECRTQNELNGRILHIKKENTEKILQILLGHPVNNTPTYSHLGQTKTQKRSALYTAV